MNSVIQSDKKTLFLFIDESGNFDFSPKGTKYFTLTAFATFDPIVQREELVKLRYKLLAQGNDHEYFHATEDKQNVRDQIFNFLASLGDTFEVHSVIARKNKANPALYREHYMKGGCPIDRITGTGLYRTVCECLLQYVFKGKKKDVQNIVVILGSIFVGDRKKTVLQTIKHSLKQQFPGVPFEIYSHRTCADLNCQLADYCCWAISVKAERGEERPFEVIKSRVKSAFDIFKAGDREYYAYSP